MYKPDVIKGIINEYLTLKIDNSETEKCLSIIKFFESKGYLTDKQVYCLKSEISKAKNPEIVYFLNENINNPAGKIVIEFPHLPKCCDDCPLQIVEYDEDSLFGDGRITSCIFGCSIWGSSIERPEDCPIKVIE